MAMMRDRIMDEGGIDRPEREPAPAPSPTPDPVTGGMESAPSPESSGSKAPPSNAGDESPDRQFPVPPVPPPPSPGPIFSLAGGGGGGAASFARPGTAAARPFRSPIFTANRSTASPGADRFGAGTAVTAGGASSPSFLPAGLAGEAGPGGPAGGDDELRRIMAVLRGGGAQ